MHRQGSAIPNQDVTWEYNSAKRPSLISEIQLKIHDNPERKYTKGSFTSTAVLTARLKATDKRLEIERLPVGVCNTGPVGGRCGMRLGEGLLSRLRESLCFQQNESQNA